MVTYMLPTAATYIPSYIILANHQLLNTYTGLIISSSVSIFGIFLLRQAFMQVPSAMVEAAQIDGASHFRILHLQSVKNQDIDLSVLIHRRIDSRIISASVYECGCLCRTHIQSECCCKCKKTCHCLFHKCPLLLPLFSAHLRYIPFLCFRTPDFCSCGQSLSQL